MDAIIDPNSLGTAAALAIVITVVGRAVKMLPSIPDWVIPWVALVMGGVGYPFLQRTWTPMAIIGGIIIGATVVGLYSTSKQTMVTRVEDAGNTVSPTVAAVFGSKTEPTATEPKKDS
jgi:hypothetical protein